jgi:DNA helicase HerA-like ATPase
MQNFREEIENGYQFKGKSIIVGAGMIDGKAQEGLAVRIPLKTLNRHGLIAGATGTGKTKSLQKIVESISKNGVSVLLMDIKGDLSGLAMAGKTNPIVEERAKMAGDSWEPTNFPVELMTLSDQDGVRLRATVTEFGPILLAKILSLNDTQQSVLSLVFKFCDDRALPLVDLDDLKKVLIYISDEGKEILEGEYGKVSSATIGTIQRKIIELESQGADLFFGEPSFDVKDLLRKDVQGRGYIHIIRLDDIQNKPKLFSTFMLQLLSEVYETFPEKGDADQPELVIFIDEAHLVFSEASSALVDRLEQVVKLIRSKGVGVFFCTQSPSDIPSGVLGQLGLKIQHALRAFTAKDRKDIKMVSENYPISSFYKIDETITTMGIGEAFVTALNEKGIPTPLVHTLMVSPESRMDILNEDEKKLILTNSVLYHKYNQTINRESAYEILNKKIDAASVVKDQQEAMKAQEKQAVEDAKQDEKLRKEQERENIRLAKERERIERENTRNSANSIENVLFKTVKRQLTNSVSREVSRGLLGALKSMFKR